MNSNAVSSIVDGVVKLAQAITAVKAALDAIDPGRSVIITASNNTAQQMVNTGQSFDHGNWGVIPPEIIPPKTSAVFGAKDTGFLTGTAGHVFFAIGGTQFDMYWDIPFIGENSGGFTMTGSGSLDF